MIAVPFLLQVLRTTVAALLVVSFAMFSVGSALAESGAGNSQCGITSQITMSAGSHDIVMVTPRTTEHDNVGSDHDLGGLCCFGLCLMTTLVAEPDFRLSDARLIQHASTYSGLIVRGLIFDMIRPPSQTI